jgi:hypothetical protein
VTSYPETGVISPTAKVADEPVGNTFAFPEVSSFPILMVAETP